MDWQAQSKLTLEAIGDALSVPVVIADNAGKVIYWNQWAGTQLSLNADGADHPVLLWDKLSHVFSPSILRRAVQDTITTHAEQIVQVEAPERLHIVGYGHWVLRRVQTQASAEPQVVLTPFMPFVQRGAATSAIMQISTDVEYDLQNEHGLQTIINNTTDGLLVVNTEGIVRFANPAILHMLERSSADLLGATFGVPVMVNEPVEIELRHKNGDLAHVEMRARSIMWHGESAYLATFHDITTLKQLQSDLRRAAAHLQAVLDSDDISCTLISPDYRIMMMNSSAQMYATSVWGKPLALDIDIRDYIPPAYLKDFLRDFERARSGEYVRFEQQHTDDDGTSRWYSVRYLPVFDPQTQAIIGVCHGAEDITARKDAEAQSFALAIERERVNLLVSFVQDVSHQFRTPLAIINTNADLAVMVNDQTRRKEKVVAIHEQVSAIEMLVDDLLTLTRLQSVSALNLQRVDIVALLADVVYGHQRNVLVKNLHVEQDMPHAPVYVQGSEEWLEKALSYVLKDALYHAPTNSTVSLALRVAGDYAELRVHDAGPNIPPDDMRHIFSTFYHDGHSQLVRGFGLGLPIARQVVERHNGQIDAESDPDAGTTFTISLPLD
jgi:PAS domain S-box-containing protein